MLRITRWPDAGSAMRNITLAGDRRRLRPAYLGVRDGRDDRQAEARAAGRLVLGRESARTIRSNTFSAIFGGSPGP